jgi:NAD/NADP transhydrogenase alpha subunit
MKSQIRMIIGIPKETKEFEKWVAHSPVTTKQLLKAGFEVRFACD